MATIEGINRHKGGMASRVVVERHKEFHEHYQTLKDLLNGLERDGKYNTGYRHIPDDWCTKVEQLIPVARFGLFYQIWEVI